MTVFMNSTNSALSAVPLSHLTPLATTVMPDEVEEDCANSHIVSVEAIMSFQQNTDCILLVCTIFSAFLQVYVMAAALKHIKKKTSDKCMHVFLFSMTFADFLLTALSLCYPVELAPRAGLIPRVPRFLNQTMHISCWVALIVSSVSLVFLNVDKLFYFRFPLRYNTMFTQSRAIALVTGSWIFSVLFVFFAWLTESFDCVDEDCLTLAIFPNKLFIYIPFMVFVGVIPTVTSLIVAIYIMKVVSQHRKQMAEERALCQSLSPGRSNSVFTTRMRTFYFIFMTTVFTAITLLPYRLAGLQRSINPGRMHDCVTILSFWIMMYMIYLNSIINPLLTVTVLPQYRIEFFNIFFRCGNAPQKRDSATTANTVDL
uniref:G-protein coupled receptors family 1 profile domain-containing protein n=1 Tax=Panagrolaimus sp. PS1159 TaxID=55785 RepID=A0AC35F907_9BILA